MTFTLRPATAADVEWLYAVRRETMQDYVEQMFGFWDDEAQRARLAEPGELANMQIIYADRRQAGLLHIERSRTDIFLANLQVRPALQGRGIGTAVIRMLMMEARASGRPLRLQVLKVNTAARRLYERLGFAVAEESESHIRMVWMPA